MNISRQTKVFLCEGQSLRTHVRRGTHILVTQGSVHLDGPCAWVGESLVSFGSRFDEGQSQLIEQTGWVEISATGEASIVQYAPPSMLTAALHALWEQAGRWLGRPEILPKNVH